MGFLNSKGVLVWKAGEKAANGTDIGCFDVDISKWRPAVDDLARIVFGAKGRGDRVLAEQTRDAWVSDGTPWAERRKTIQEAAARQPVSFVFNRSESAGALTDARRNHLRSSRAVRTPGRDAIISSQGCAASGAVPKAALPIGV
jgi:hypothetical protein